MSAGLYSGTSGLALGVGLYAGNPGLWGGGAGLDAGLSAALYLDFLAGAPLDSRITFSRGSNATLVDSTGKVTYAPNNLLTYSQEFDNAAWTKTNATVTANSATAPDGTSTADSLIENTVNGVHDARRSVTASALTTYTQSIFVKASGRTRGQMQMFGNSGGSTINYNLTAGTATAAGAYGGWTGASATITNYGNGWYRITNTATTNAGLTTLVAAYLLADASGSASYTGDGTSGMLYWGAQVEAVTYQTTPSTYNATTASAYYGPRFDYDPVTLAPKGLLIEEQRTNLLTYSEQFDNAAWSKSNITVTANTTVAPDGTNAGDTITGVTAGAANFLTRTITASATQYTYSIWVMAGTANTCALLIRDVTSATNLAATAQIISGPGSFSGTAVITVSGLSTTQWTRISITLNAAATAGNTLQAYFYPETSVSASTTAKSNIIWGAQLEAGAFATSYIPTVAATVTRSADIATMSGTNFSDWYNQSEGTIFASVDTAAPTGSTVLSFQDGAGASTNRHQMNIYSSFTATVVSNVIQSNIGTNTNTSPKLVYAYKANDFAACANGAAVATDTSGTVPTSLAYATLGKWDFGSGASLNGHIRAIAYYPQRLPNATLQALTA